MIIELSSVCNSIIETNEKIICDQFLISLTDTISTSLNLFHQAPNKNGIYFLYWNDILVYIGKSSGIKGSTICGRLKSAYNKINSRQNISINEMKWKCVIIENKNQKWIDTIEQILITYFDPEWNRIGGFGYRGGKDDYHNKNDKKEYRRKWDLMFPPKNLKINRLFEACGQSAQS